MLKGHLVVTVLMLLSAFTNMKGMEYDTTYDQITSISTLGRPYDFCGTPDAFKSKSLVSTK